jgi:chromosome segregation ATPase
MRTKLIALGLLVAGAVAASGQSQRQPSTLDDVVAEIRALRADLRSNAAATARTQLLTARLQLQEQRITVLANQRADVTARLAVESRLREDAAQRVQTFDESKNTNESLGISRAELEGTERHFKSEYAQHLKAEQQLRAQESDFSAQIAAEQNRWQDFNDRLDELERSLK